MEDAITIKIDEKVPPMMVVCNSFTADILSDVSGITLDNQDGD